MSEHSPCGPSSLERRELCPSSYRMEKDLPDQPSEAAQKGTDLHAVTMALLQDRLSVPVNPDGSKIKPADLDACWEVVNFVDEQRAKTFSSEPIFLFEHKIDLSFIHELIGFGTCDIALVEPYDHGLIVDAKFGWNTVTEAERNRQISAYCLGLMRAYELNSCEGFILQPFKNRSSRAYFDQSNSGPYKDVLYDIAEGCLSPTAPLRPSEKACQFCRAASVCPELKGKTDALTVQKKPVESLAPQELALWLDACELAEIRIGAVRAEAYRRLTAGGSLPGWGLVDGRRTREWALEDKVLIQTLLDAARELEKSPDDVLRTEVATPSQLEQAWGKSKPIKALLEKLVEWKPGKQKLDRIQSEAKALPE